jgi:hypothetical protein
MASVSSLASSLIPRAYVLPLFSKGDSSTLKMASASSASHPIPLFLSSFFLELPPSAY